MINTPCARNSDPDTSKQSDRILTQSGRRCKQVKLVELLVERHSGYTARELAAITGADFEMLHKRLPESLKVVKGGNTVCLISGYPATIWVLR